LSGAKILKEKQNDSRNFIFFGLIVANLDDTIVRGQVCTTSELSQLIRLEIPEEKIDEICGYVIKATKKKVMK